MYTHIFVCYVYHVEHMCICAFTMTHVNNKAICMCIYIYIYLFFVSAYHATLASVHVCANNILETKLQWP